MFFYPDLMVDKVTDINDGILRGLRIKNILLDIDDTISPNDGTAVTNDILNWIETLRKKSYRIVLISNNSRDRAEHFAGMLDVPCVYKAMKPLPFGINKGMRLLSAERDNTVLIGDQIFTDVVGSRLCKIKSILVEPLNKEGGFFLKLKRLLEGRIKCSCRQK